MGKGNIVMTNFTLLNNPVVKNIGLKLHDKDINPHEYRESARLLGLYMGIDLASRDILPTKKETTKTPLGSLTSEITDEDKIGIVNVLRAGTTMALGMGEAFPNSCISFISAWRRQEGDKIIADTDYNRGIEDLDNKVVIITDPALASGSSLLACIDVIYKKVKPKKVLICCLHSATKGIKNIGKEYPDINIYSVFGPSDLNEKFYIVNGPGDCGDRCFGTK
jgi:uracil phosphoribosyltransferase